MFRGQYAAVTEVEALDISVLGRDITGLFAVIVDQPLEGSSDSDDQYIANEPPTLQNILAATASLGV